MVDMIIIIIIPSVDIFPKGLIIKQTGYAKIGYDRSSVQSSGKLSQRIALKRCTRTEIRWNKYCVSLLLLLLLLL